MLQLVIPYKKHASTTSRLIAEKFGRRHGDVLKSIEELDCSEVFRERHFTLSFIIRELPNGGNKQEREYILTRDGFALLMMKFSGPTASKFREEFIEQFNRMEDVLRQEEVAKNPIPVYTMRVLSNPIKELPRGYWTVFDKSHAILLLIETKIGCQNRFDLADGSIGKMWVTYRKDKFWAMEPGLCKYEFDDGRGTQDIKCYHGSELQYFEDWLMFTYKFEHLPKYLINKYKSEGNLLMLEKVKAVLPKLLKRSA